MASVVALLGIGLERAHRPGKPVPDLSGNAWAEQKGKGSREPHAVNDLRSALCRNNRVLEVDAEPRDVALDGERAACRALRDQHRNTHPLAGNYPALCSHRERSIEPGLLCIRIPQVPAVDLAPNLIDDRGRDGNVDAFFNMRQFGGSPYHCVKVTGPVIRRREVSEYWPAA